MRNDGNDILRQLSPNTWAIFNTAREFGINPDAMDAEALTQLEVSLGLQSRWLLGENALKDLSLTDYFTWCARNGLIQIGGLVIADLCDIQVKADEATACIQVGENVLTNSVLSFSRHNRKWKLDFDKLLLATETPFAAMRTASHLNKMETAVMLIEGAHKQPIPVLRELLLTPELRQQVASLQTTTPEKVYEAVLHELSAGRQKNAEDLLQVFVGIHTNHQRLAFAQAVCTRSRFDILKADMQFRRVLEMNPRTVEGNCARYVLDLDDQSRMDESFAGLHLLMTDNPDDALLYWILGIECRDHYRHTGRTDRSAEGARAYQQLLELFDMGPVLVHQTYANILSEELGQLEEALKHRRIAVSLEPKSWTYNGLAGTLTALEQFEEADQVYAKVVELVPDDPVYWHNWAVSRFQYHRFEDCISKSKRALEIDPGFYKARYSWGLALERQGNRKKALEQYEETIRLNPAFPYAYDAAARVLNILGDPNRAQEYLDKKSRLPVSAQPSKDETNPSYPN